MINVAIALRDSDSEKIFCDDYLVNKIIASPDIEYFSCIYVLYYMKDDKRYDQLKKSLFFKIKEHFSESSEIINNSHDLHLLLDVVSCPYLSLELRTKLIKITWAKLGLPRKD